VLFASAHIPNPLLVELTLRWKQPRAHFFCAIGIPTYSALHMASSASAVRSLFNMEI
jgi:hypothetical protein